MTSVRILSNVRGELRPVFGFTECVVPFANHAISRYSSVESACEPSTFLMKHNGVPSLVFFTAPVASTSEASLPDLVGWREWDVRGDCGDQRLQFGIVGRC